jgi:hypothetical protein
VKNLGSNMEKDEYPRRKRMWSTNMSRIANPLTTSMLAILLMKA